MSANTNENHVRPLVVGMTDATVLLNCCVDTLYELIRRKELDSYLEGMRRKITVDSIERLIQRRVAAKHGKLDRSQLVEKRLVAQRAKVKRRRRSHTSAAEPAA